MSLRSFRSLGVRWRNSKVFVQLKQMFVGTPQYSVQAYIWKHSVEWQFIWKVTPWVMQPHLVVFPVFFVKDSLSQWSFGRFFWLYALNRHLARCLSPEVPPPETRPSESFRPPKTTSESPEARGQSVLSSGFDVPRWGSYDQLFVVNTKEVFEKMKRYMNRNVYYLSI